MNHENVQQQISQFMDNELPKEQLHELFIHLAECVDCREFFAETKKIHDAVRTLADEPFPATMDRKFSILEVGDDRPINITKNTLISIPTAMLSVIALFLLGFSVLLTFQTAPGPETERQQQTFNDLQFFNGQVPLRN